MTSRTNSPPPPSPMALVHAWRTQAAMYHRDGVTVAARLLERVAEELESIAGGETVTLAEAARRTGYSPDHLRRHFVDTGALTNVGRRHQPRFRAHDLPVKGHRYRKSEKSDILSGQSNDGTR